jgi:hypothetical protein
MSNPLNWRVARPQKCGAPSDQIFSHMAGILPRCEKKSYLRTDLTFVLIDQALYYLVSVILSISLQAIFGIYLGCFARPIWLIFIVANWVVAGQAQ